MQVVMNCIFAFDLLLVLFCSQTEPLHGAWYDNLPDERLNGAPRRLVQNEKYFRFFKRILFNVLGRTGETEQIINRARQMKLLQDIPNSSMPFPCPMKIPRSPRRPTSVHEIRLGDIDVVAALGDSLIAGNGAFAITILQTSVENRGVSSPVGGQGNWRQYLTLPNLLKIYNPNLKGYSTGDGISADKKAGFNMAEPGAMTQDLPHMTEVLVRKIKKDPTVDFQNDWKLVTVLIGANNFCSDFCYLKNSADSIETHRGALTKSLIYMRDHMPRTIVNLLHSINLKNIVELKNVPQRCVMVHKLDCPCLYTLQHLLRLPEFYETIRAWQKVEEEVVADERFRTKDDFTVNLLPGTKDPSVPLKRNLKTGKMEEDYSVLAWDCFHFSQKGGSLATIGLWNNMLEPVGNKTSDWRKITDKFICPSEERPFIFTWKNSRS